MDEAVVVSVSLFRCQMFRRQMESLRPQHFLYLRPLPQGQGALRPMRCRLVKHVGVYLVDFARRHGDVAGATAA